MKRKVRIGGAGGFWGDSPAGMEQLVTCGDVDYVIHDYLAELTMAILARQKDRDPDAGFATDFVALQLRPILREIVDRGVRVVTNAGGINPQACAKALGALARSAGIDIRIGVVEGDDLMPIEGRLRERGVTEMFTGEPLPEQLTSMNAYIGAFPIADALARGADIVVTGRCADSALALGPLIHEFGWSAGDFDLLAAGSLAGHIIECGTQATGGLFTDWELVENRADLGYPIAECYPDGSFLVTKPAGTGGLVTPLVVTEQMLYELGDPRNYLLPDVTCDLSAVRVEQAAPDVVKLTGIRGRAPTSTYKVSAVFADGFRANAVLTTVGRNAAAKADEIARAALERTRAMLRRSNLGDFSETSIEILGSEVPSFGENAAPMRPRETVLRLSVRHPEPEAIRIFAREIAPFGTGGPPGTTGLSGRPKGQEVYRLFSFLVDKSDVEVTVDVDGDRRRFAAPATTAGFETAASPVMEDALLDAGRADEMVEAPLRTIAVARSGDKADISHLAIIARHPDFYPALVRQLTVERVKDYFRHLVRGEVVRYDVPGVHALSFLLHEALGGGGAASLRNDALGKAFGEIALDIAVAIPAAWLNHDAFASHAMEPAVR